MKPLLFFKSCSYPLFCLVFYHLCYEGSIDLTSITDPAQRHALEVQIMEFGQIPKQVFKHPHPKRIIHSPSQHLLVDRAASENYEDVGKHQHVWS